MRLSWVAALLGCGVGERSRPADAGALDAAPDTFVPDDTRYESPCLEDVVKAFERIPTGGARLAFFAGDAGDEAALIPWPRYTSTPENDYGVDNHFQGVQRLRSGAYLALSGSDVHSGVASIFVVHMASRLSTGRWESNLKTPPGVDSVVGRIDPDPTFWHAGGLATLGDLLVVPVETKLASRIVFYDVSEAGTLVPLAPFIGRTGATAASVAATRVDGRYLVVVREESAFDFYLSRSAFFSDGFYPSPFVRWEAPNSPDFWGILDAQNFNFVRQCDGRLFVVSLRNTSAVAPVVPGADAAYLYEVVVPGEGSSDPLSVAPITSKTFCCVGGLQCNFDAAAGTFVTHDGDLIVYATPHFRAPLSQGETATHLRFNEF